MRCNAALSHGKDAAMRIGNQLVVAGMTALLATCSSGQKNDKVVSYSSPSGRIGIHIRLGADVKADDPLNDMQVAYFRYTVEFADSMGQPLAQAVYHDVYGMEGEAIETADLVRWMTWSPNEDFVLLPAEGWMTAPGTVAVTAVNLNPRFRWTTSQVAIDDQVWIDTLRIIGNDLSDCAYSVVMFDGRTGETRMIKASESPIGYAIARVETRSLLIQSQPDNCASEAERAAFAPECWEFSLELFALKKVHCPQ